MKVFLSAMALTLVSAGALAQEATFADDHSRSLKTRAEVRTEVETALAQGALIRSGEASYVVVAPAPRATRTRAEVRAEVVAALANGQALRYGEAPLAGDYEQLNRVVSATVLAGASAASTAR